MASNLFKPSMPEDFFSTNIENVCRICLQTSITLSTIFRDEIDEMISEFLPAKVDLRDNYPHQICRKCLEDVKIAYAFKKQAEYSHEVIKKMLDGKRLPRSSNKKSYQEINENNIFRTKSLPSDPVKDPSDPEFRCHICEKNLARKNALKRHLQQVHKFFRFEEFYAHLTSSNKKNSAVKKEIPEESYIEEMTFPILPQVIMVDDENDMEVDDDNNDDDHSMEDKDDPFKSHNEEITNRNSSKLKTSTPVQQQQLAFECHICHKTLTRRYYLKCHLERVHHFYNIDSVKIKMVPLKSSKMSESNVQKYKSKHDDRSEGSFECRICKKILARRYGLKKHYELVHNIIDNERPIDLTYDGSSDDNERSFPVPRLNSSKIKSEKSIPNTNKQKQTRTKLVNVYICHICEKEFSARATMRRHLKNVHKFTEFEDNIWLSKVYQKSVEQEEEVNTAKTEPDFDQNYKQDDDDIDMHAYLLCPEVVLTTGEDNHPGGSNSKHGESSSSGLSTSNVASKSDGRYNTDVNGLKNDLKTEGDDTEIIKKVPNKVEPIKLKLGVLSIQEVSPSEKKPPKINKYLFSCTYCKKPFNRLDHLKRHERTHSKPYKCQYCAKGFYREDLLNRHENSAHSKLFQQQSQRPGGGGDGGSDYHHGFNFNFGIMDAFNEYDMQDQDLDNENSFDDNDNDNENYNENDNENDDEIENDYDDHKNFEEDENEQNSNQDSNMTDAKKEDSNADIIDNSRIKEDTEEKNENSNSIAAAASADASPVADIIEKSNNVDENKPDINTTNTENTNEQNNINSWQSNNSSFN